MLEHFHLKNLLKILIKKVFPILLFFFILLGLFLYITKDGYKTTQKFIKVQIEGAVRNPGIKSLKENSIVQDLVDESNGFSDLYDKDYVESKVNLVKKLKDGDKIFIPFIKTDSNSPDSQNITQKISGKININTADLKLLDSLPGIGPTTAKKILENRPYKSIKDLLDKKIVNNGVYQKIESQIEI